MYSLNNRSKSIFIVLIAGLFTVIMTQSASADLGIVDSISGGFAEGFNKILISITDQLYEFAGANNTNVTETMVMVYAEPNDFLENPAVQENKDFSMAWYSIFYLVFFIGGFIKLLYSEATYEGYGEGPTWGKAYYTGVIAFPLAGLFYLYGLQGLFDVEYAIRQSATLQLTSIIPPTANNAVAYFFLGIQKIVNILFGQYRYILLAIMSGSAVFIVILYSWGRTEHFAEILVEYFLVLLFSLFVITLIYVFGNSIIEGSTFLKSMSPAPYAIVLLIAVMVIFIMILYPIKFLLVGVAKIK